MFGFNVGPVAYNLNWMVWGKIKQLVNCSTGQKRRKMRRETKSKERKIKALSKSIIFFQFFGVQTMGSFIIIVDDKIFNEIQHHSAKCICTYWPSESQQRKEHCICCRPACGILLVLSRCSRVDWWQKEMMGWHPEAHTDLSYPRPQVVTCRLSCIVRIVTFLIIQPIS